MLSTSPPKKHATGTGTTVRGDEQAPELKFIAELGRSLLLAAHPKKAGARLCEELREGVDADICGFIVELEHIGHIAVAHTSAGETGDGSVDRSRFDRWLSFMPPQIAYAETDKGEFFLAGEHTVEYVSPLHINGSIGGAVVVGFSDAEMLTERRTRLIEAATQVGALSTNLAAHYEIALTDSITETREAQRKFTEAILDALPVSLYVVDRDYKIVTWNRHREIGKLGVPRDLAIGRDVFDVLDKFPRGRVREEFERAFRTGRIERIEQQTVADDGSTRHWLVSKVPMTNAETNEVTHVISVGEDVTVRVEALHAMNRAEKLAAVGRLAAGVVHEINNPLATIAACAEALEQRVDEGAFEVSEATSDLAEYLSLIKSEAFRCKTITSDLLDFSRVRVGERVPVDLADVVRAAANLVVHQKRGKGIEYIVEADSDLPLVAADGGQIQQAIIALATNAIDAMPTGGTLSFRVSSDGSRVIVEVEDTGSGIPAEDLPRIFEPFFTTKAVGQGTGLGLAVCYGIISEHGGRISVRSTPGRGTVFSINLPTAQ